MKRRIFCQIKMRGYFQHLRKYVAEEFPYRKLVLVNNISRILRTMKIAKSRIPTKIPHPDMANPGSLKSTWDSHWLLAASRLMKSASFLI